MLRRLLALGLLMTATVALPLLPVSEAQQKVCPRGVQVNQIQQRSQQQQQYQQQQRQAQEQQQRRVVEQNRQIQAQRQQAEARTRQATQQQPRTVSKPVTTLTPVTREVTTPTRNVVTASRSVTSKPVTAVPGMPGRSVATPVTTITPRPVTMTTTSRSVTEGVTRSRQVDLVPVTQRVTTTQARTVPTQSREVTQRSTTITQEARQVNVTSRAVHQESVKITQRSRSVHETRNITTVQWTLSCMQCHTTGRLPEPVAQRRPEPPNIIRQPPQPAPRFPILDPRRPKDAPTPIVRPLPQPPFPLPPRTMPLPEIIARTAPRPQFPLPTGPAVRFPIIDPRPQPLPTPIPILRDRPLPEPWAERPAQRPLPLLDPLGPSRKLAPEPAADPRLLEAIPRDALERPTAPRLRELIADPALATFRREVPASPPVARHDDPTEPPGPVYSEADLQAPSLPALPESVLALRRSEDVILDVRELELMPSLGDLAEAQEQIPAELQMPTRDRDTAGGTARPISARLTAREALAAPSLPALPESVLGPG